MQKSGLFDHYSGLKRTPAPDFREPSQGASAGFFPGFPLQASAESENSENVR
jgi:hypothetical protein